MPLLLIGVVTLSLASSARIEAQTNGQGTPSEDAVKAEFIYNFTKYVEWPTVTPGNPGPIRVCVPAYEAFLEILKSSIQGALVNGRPLMAMAPEGLDDARSCDILYVGDASTADARSWVAASRGSHVLTVGDGHTTGLDVVIAFVRDEGRVRFDVNRAAASRQGLSISSRLLRLARRVVG